MDGTSRVTGDCHAGFCERLGVKFPGATRRRSAMVVPYRDENLAVWLTYDSFQIADHPPTIILSAPGSPTQSFWSRSKVEAYSVILKVIS
jgi:hypothetical protein